MAKRFELIVFDWDGTLMDSAAASSCGRSSCERRPGAAGAAGRAGPARDWPGPADALRHAVPELARRWIIRRWSSAIVTISGHRPRADALRRSRP